MSITFPGGLVVRIRRSHRRGRGSIPRQGNFFYCLVFPHSIQIYSTNVFDTLLSYLLCNCHWIQYHVHVGLYLSFWNSDEDEDVSRDVKETLAYETETETFL